MDLDKLFDHFLELKAKDNLRVVDIHIHPLNVLGTSSIEKNNILYKKEPSLLERMEYNQFSLSILKAMFYIFPSYIRREVNKKFLNYNTETLENEMRIAGVDEGVLIPVEPFVSTEKIANSYYSNNYAFVGSLDLKKLELEEIEKHVEWQINKFGIIGLKLHPNIQEFYPQPSMNDRNTELKLRRIYEIAEVRKFFIIFHGGISYMLEGKVKREFATLKNFCNSDGKSDVFKYRIPFIIAHFGNYNMPHPNFDFLKFIASQFSNVFFDTSGVSPFIIAKGIEAVGINRVLFGSDAPYFDIKYNLQLVLKALFMANVKENYSERVRAIFSSNFRETIRIL